MCAIKRPVGRFFIFSVHERHGKRAIASEASCHFVGAVFPLNVRFGFLLCGHVTLRLVPP